MSDDTMADDLRFQKWRSRGGRTGNGGADVAALAELLGDEAATSAQLLRYSPPESAEPGTSFISCDSGTLRR